MFPVSVGLLRAFLKARMLCHQRLAVPWGGRQVWNFTLCVPVLNHFTASSLVLLENHKHVALTLARLQAGIFLSRTS